MIETANRVDVVACDIDGTLRTGNPDEQAYSEQAQAELLQAIRARQKNSEEPLHIGTATGRVNWSHDKLERDEPTFSALMSVADFKITAVGSSVLWRNEKGIFLQDTEWPGVESWDRAQILIAMWARNVRLGRTEVTPQSEYVQTPHKLSFSVKDVPDSAHNAYIAEINSDLARYDLSAQVIFSGGMYLDFLPEGVEKGSAVRYVAGQFAVKHALQQEPVLPVARKNPVVTAAGDSMNDCHLLAAAHQAILPGNADASLRAWAEAALVPENLYIADERFAAGVLEGMRHFGLVA